MAEGHSFTLRTTMSGEAVQALLRRVATRPRKVALEDIQLCFGGPSLKRYRFTFANAADAGDFRAQLRSIVTKVPAANDEPGMDFGAPAGA